MDKTKQAVSQQKQDNSLSVQTVQIGKQTASFLVPDYNEGQKLAVIDEGVLKYLKNLLPKASSDEILTNFIDELVNIRGFSTTKEMLSKAVDAAKDFVAFHESVNLVNKYFNPSLKIVMEKPFNVAEPEPTLNELVNVWQKLEARICGELDGISLSAYINSPDYINWLIENKLYDGNKSEPTVVA